MRNWYRSLPNWFKAGASTFFFAFFTIFGVGLAGWLQDVITWANDWSDGSGSAVFPALSTLGYLFVAAIASAAIGIVNGLWRFAQSKSTVIPGEGPNYSGTENDFLD